MATSSCGWFQTCAITFRTWSFWGQESDEHYIHINPMHRSGVKKRRKEQNFLGFHILVSEISQMLWLCMPWNHMDYSILSEAKKSIPPSRTIIWRICYGISLKGGFHRRQMGWGHFRANNSFLSCSRSSILREHFGGQIIPSCSRSIFYTLF